ncbi:WXG100 family type VII secretion target [Demequina activiva]|uniref:WXG100 family type VII secretion target n=1 Tax=Demequina activiva TaxID=1582364 RepID=A0A919Q242_9MICO|nr:WXG100 family type VII secretion target [Demequina activiva]GIG53852.1 hypothetical protein Dac01nite_06040 [Demequina activiva]
MAHFSVSTGSIAGSAAALSGLLAEFDQHVDAANGAVTGVVGASWNGAASDTFGESWSSFLIDAAATRAALASIVQRMGGAEATYESTEASNTSAAQSGAAAMRSGGSSANRGGAATAEAR